MQPLTKMLNSVNIASSKPLIENKIDMTIVNVDAYITNSGNTALDLLSASPNVEVDPSSGISIKGKSGVVILIDGKQTYLGGSDLMNLLNSMPSSQISQIEIMTQPSAKYDAAGNSGVINLITKKNKQTGFNANLSLNYAQGVYPKSLNNLNMNYRRDKVNLFGNLGYNYNETFTDRLWLTSFTGGNQNTLVRQSNRDHRTAPTLTGSAGMDYAIDSLTTIGIAASASSTKYRDGFSSHSVLENLNDNGNVQAITEGLSIYDRPWTTTGLNLNFKTSFDPRQQLTADVNYDQYHFRENEHDSTVNRNADGTFNNLFLQQVKLPSSIAIYTAKADYAYTAGKSLKIEAGIKSSLVKTDNDAEYFQFQNGTYVLNTNLSNHFIYNENVNAAYVNYTGVIGQWNVQLGLRAEHTHNHGQQIVGDQAFAKIYLQLFPTAYLGYSLDKDNLFELSFGRRVDRPNYSDLNPFVQYVDVYTRSVGNANLNPVFTNNLELSYNYKSNLNISAFYTSTNGVINMVYLQNDTSRIQYVTLNNIGRELSTGININCNVPVKNWWTITAFGTIFNNHFKGPINDGFVNANLTTYMINVTNQVLLGDGWAAEMNLSYRSKALLFALFDRGPRRTNTFGLSKELFNKKGSIKLKITDPFNLTRNNYNYSRFEGLYIYRNFQEENRLVGLTFTYRFSQGKKLSNSGKKNYKPEENNRIVVPSS